MKFIVTYGRNKGPKWLHWITWAGNWSAYLAWIQGSDFSHFCIKGEGKRAGWVLDANISPGELDDGTPLPRRLVFRSGVGWRRWKPKDYVRYLEIDFPQLDYDDAMEIVCLEKMVGMPYDWCGLFWLLVAKWRRPKSITNRWKKVERYCTEVGAWVAYVMWQCYGTQPVVHPAVSAAFVLVDDYQKSLAGVWKDEDIVYPQESLKSVT